MRRSAAILGLLLVNSPIAWGCGICVSAMADAVLPPIYWWAALAMLWFLASAFVSRVFQTRLPSFPRFRDAILIALVSLLLSASVLGAPLLLLLIPASAIPFGMAPFSGREPFDRWGFRLSIIGVGICAIVAVIMMASWSHRIRTTRSRPDFLLQWSGTGSERKILHRMTKEDPEPLDEYRYLYQHAGLVTASFVAKRIGEIGDPERDIALLESRLIDLQTDYGADMFLEDIEAAIASLKRKKAKGLDSETPSE